MNVRDTVGVRDIGERLGDIVTDGDGAVMMTDVDALRDGCDGDGDTDDVRDSEPVSDDDSV